LNNEHKTDVLGDKLSRIDFVRSVPKKLKIKGKIEVGLLYQK
jgi:hypothetical protein